MPSSTADDVPEWVPGDAPHLDPITYSDERLYGRRTAAILSRHPKASFYCVTEDGWRLHLVRTQSGRGITLNSAAREQPVPRRRYPVVLCPGLASSGAYTFDLAPAVSLADFLAERGWDVWTVELRGNGLSDKPRPLVRSRWWTVDDYIKKDVPALLAFVVRKTGCSKVHFLGHSMGGMIMTATLAEGGPAAQAMASGIAVASGCFLKGSGWQKFVPVMPMSRLMWTVPAGGALRLYSRLAGTWLALPIVDEMYVVKGNTDTRLTRALMARNFSDLSPGVVLQFSTAFSDNGICSADGRRFADAKRLGAVNTPVMFVAGDRDRMCPPEGCRRTLQLFGSKDKRFVMLGPDSGQRLHYGHFDPLIGQYVEEEVFPLIHEFFQTHDGPADSLALQQAPPPGRAAPAGPADGLALAAQQPWGPAHARGQRQQQQQAEQQRPQQHQQQHLQSEEQQHHRAEEHQRQQQQQRGERQQQQEKEQEGQRQGWTQHLRRQQHGAQKPPEQQQQRVAAGQQQTPQRHPAQLSTLLGTPQPAGGLLNRPPPQPPPPPPAPLPLPVSLLTSQPPSYSGGVPLSPAPEQRAVVSLELEMEAAAGAAAGGMPLLRSKL